MGALKLCTYKKAEYPLYLEMLSLHVYTMEELCYAMESSLFLLDEILVYMLHLRQVVRHADNGVFDGWVDLFHQGQYLQPDFIALVHRFPIGAVVHVVEGMFLYILVDFSFREAEHGADDVSILG